jgi:hypothetical protein
VVSKSPGPFDSHQLGTSTSEASRIGYAADISSMCFSPVQKEEWLFPRENLDPIIRSHTGRRISLPSCRQTTNQLVDHGLLVENQPMARGWWDRGLLEEGCPTARGWWDRGLLAESWNLLKVCP